MTAKEIAFDKYLLRGAYHWGNVSWNPFRRNPYVLGRYRNILSLLASRLGEMPHKPKTLEVGCGDGVLSCLMAKEGMEVSAIDSSELAIDYAKNKAEGARLTVDFRVASAYSLPYESNVFDAVVSSDVVEHLQDVDAYLSEIKRVLVPGGVAVISTPIRFTHTPIDQLHVCEWYPSEYIVLINAVFPDSKFYKSHPLVWMELLKASSWEKLLVVLLSYLSNPFEGFHTRFAHSTLQYSVSVKQ